MSFKNFIKKIFKGEDKQDDSDFFLALADFEQKIKKSASKNSDGSTRIDLRAIATNFGKVYVMNDNENKAVTYLSTLTREELWGKYNETYLLQELSKDSYYDYVFPDADHPYIMYYISPSDFMRLAQKEIGCRGFSRKS